MRVRWLGSLSIAALCACLISFAIPARAQVSSATVVGTVTDTSGAVIPGATVKITNTGTNITQTKSTGTAGDYVFNNLIPGTYTLEVTDTGFKAFQVSSFSLAAGDTKREDAKLQVGAVTQTVQVTATTPALQTQTASLSTLVTSQAVENIPLNGRNVANLVQLAPGVNGGQPNDLMSGTRPDDRRPMFEFSANGANDYANDSMVDGFDNNAPIGTNIVRPSIDAIKQVVVQTNTYSAKLTRNAGAAVNIITKSGTNQFHGSLYEFLRNKVLNANPSYSFPSGFSAAGAPLYTGVAPKGGFIQNQYGGSIGGPIRKDKTFFFFDWEQFRKGQSAPTVDTVPTLCNRGLAVCPDGLTQYGDFSDQPSISKYGGSPSTCTQDGSSSCPYVDIQPSQMTTLGKAYFNMMPLPTTSGLTNNYTTNIKLVQNYTTWDLRIDQHFNNNNTFFGRYSFNDTTTLTPTDFGVVHIDPATGNKVASGGVAVNTGAFAFGHANNFPGAAYERSQQIALSWSHIFTPNFLMTLSAAYTRWANNSLQPNGGTNNVATALGFPCNSISCINTGQTVTAGIPDVQIHGVQELLGDAIYLPIQYYDNTYQYMGDFTVTKNKHSIEFGLSVIRHLISFRQGSNPRGSFNFTGGYTGVGYGDLLTGNAAGYLTGNARSTPLDFPNSRDVELGLYIQDNYRATNKLTLNLGMRYDIFTAPEERHGRFSNWDPSTGYMVSPAFPGAQQSNNSGNVQTNYLNFSPRIGFAYSATPTLVVRGGYGITFCPLCGHQYGLGNLGIQPAAPPFTFNYSCEAQNQSNTNQECSGMFTNPSAVVHYGPPTSQTSSQVNGSGGLYLPGGSPVPVLNFALVQAPTTCTGGNLTPGQQVPTGCTLGGGNLYAFLGRLGSAGPKFPTPYIQQFSLEVQKDFAGNVLAVGYVGELGRHQPFRLNMNTPNNGNIAGQPPLAYQAGYPWLNYNPLYIQWNEGTTSYNALQVAFTRRFKAGLTTSINYTWSHSFYNGQGLCHTSVGPAQLGYAGASYVDPCFYDNGVNHHIVVNQMLSGPGDMGNPAIDVPSRLAGTISYQLPFGKSATGFRGQLEKGWTVNADGYWQSGLPFNATNGVGVPGVGGGLIQVCSGKAAHPSLEDWMNEACFAQPSDNTYGVQTMNQMFGPRQRTLDFSFMKNFTLTERFTMQFRTEVFNLLNVVNFGPPGGTPGNGSSSASIAAFPVDPNTGKVLPGALGLPHSSPTSLYSGAITSLNPTLPAREIQFALKILF